MRCTPQPWPGIRRSFCACLTCWLGSGPSWRRAARGGAASHVGACRWCTMVIVLRWHLQCGFVCVTDPGPGDAAALHSAVAPVQALHRHVTVASGMPWLCQVPGRHGHACRNRPPRLSPTGRLHTILAALLCREPEAWLTQLTADVPCHAAAPSMALRGHATAWHQVTSILYSHCTSPHHVFTLITSSLHPPAHHLMTTCLLRRLQGPGHFDRRRRQEACCPG